MADEQPQAGYEIFWLPVVLFSYFFARLSHLTILPIFNDEAFYIRWAAIIHDKPSSLWISLVDGKTPLFFWVNALTYGWIADPLFSGRIISVVSGCATILLLYATGACLRKPLAGVMAGFLYTFLPYAILNDRLATVDSFQTMLVMACLYMTIRISRAEKFSWAGAAGLGLAMSAAFYAKTPTLLIIPLPALTILVMRGDRSARSTLIKLAAAYAILLAAIAIYITRDVPMIGEGGSRLWHRSRFFIPLDELLGFPIDMWASNFGDLAGYLWFYFTPPLIIAAIAAIAFAVKRKKKMTLLIALWSLVPMAAILMLTKETFSRYYLVVLMPLLMVISIETWDFLKNAILLTAWKKYISITLIALGALIFVGFSAVRVTIPYITNPAKTSFVARDRWQYIEGYPSGYGLDQVFSILKSKAAEGQITVFTTLNWGNPADALWLHLHSTPNIRVIECFWWNKAPILPTGATTIPIINNKFQMDKVESLNLADLGDAYFVTVSNSLPRELFESANPGAVLAYNLPKPYGPDSYYIYKITPPVK